MRNKFSLLLTVLGAVVLHGAMLRPSLAAQGSSSEPQQNPPEAGPQTPGSQDLDDQKLNLSADQKNQIKQIHENAKSQVESIRNDSSLTPEQKEQKIKQIRQGTRKQTMGVLTPEQQKIWKAKHREHRGEHRRHRRRRAS